MACARFVLLSSQDTTVQLSMDNRAGHGALRAALQARRGGRHILRGLEDIA